MCAQLKTDGEIIYLATDPEYPPDSFSSGQISPNASSAMFVLPSWPVCLLIEKEQKRTCFTVERPMTLKALEGFSSFTSL